MLIAQLIGGLLAHLLDIVVIVPAVVVGVVVSSWRGLVISFLITWFIVLAIKIPTIAEVARALNKPERSYIETGMWYATAILLWIGLVVLLRRLFSGRWPTNLTP